jgi:hypothetical protein
MYKFEDLMIGDMFNTMSGRWVKISTYNAICVMSSMWEIGHIVNSSYFENSTIILLYSSLLVTPNELRDSTNE